MSHKKAAELIRRTWKDAWDAAGALTATIKVQHENHRFKRPEGATWARLTLLTGETTSASIGPKGLRRTPFILTVQLFLKEGKGTAEAREIADALDREIADRSIYDAATETVVRFRPVGLGATTEPGEEKSASRNFNVTIRGTYDTTTP